MKYFLLAILLGQINLIKAPKDTLTQIPLLQRVFKYAGDMKAKYILANTTSSWSETLAYELDPKHEAFIEKGEITDLIFFCPTEEMIKKYSSANWEEIASKAIQTFPIVNLLHVPIKQFKLPVFNASNNSLEPANKTLISLTTPKTLEILTTGFLHNFINLKQVNLRHSQIKELPDHTLTLCDNLTNLYFPPILEQIGDSCLNNTQIIETNITDTQLIKIGNDCFKTVNMKKIILPKTLKEIGLNAFRYSKIENLDLSLTQVQIIKSYIGAHSEINEIILPNTIEIIEPFFLACIKNLELLDISNTQIFSKPFKFLRSSHAKTLIISKQAIKKEFMDCANTIIIKTLDEK